MEVPLTLNAGRDTLISRVRSRRLATLQPRDAGEKHRIGRSGSRPQASRSQTVRWITPERRATEGRRFQVESTGTNEPAARFLLNSAEEETGRESGGDRDGSEQARRGRSARDFATT